jgi:hypothetical protein
METMDDLILAAVVMAVMPQPGQVGLDNQPPAVTATCSQAVFHISPDTTAVNP